MSLAKISILGRLFDRAISLVIISLGAIVAGATAFAGV